MSVVSHAGGDNDSLGRKKSLVWDTIGVPVGLVGGFIRGKEYESPPERKRLLLKLMRGLTAEGFRPLMRSHFQFDFLLSPALLDVRLL